MPTPICVRCQKNPAVVFVTRIDEQGTSKNEGYCLPCARELEIGPINEIFEQFGLSAEDAESLNNDMGEIIANPQAFLSQIMPPNADEASTADEDSDDDEGKTATYPFLDRIFNQLRPTAGEPIERSEPTPPAARPKRDEQRGSSDDKAPPRKKFKFLDSYCIHLTQRARDGKLDKIIGREDETERVVQILNRRQKNNPCLIGEPGVGKTAIAEGLALRIAEGNVPDKLLSKEIYLLDMTALVAGTQFRGQFESRMKGLIEEIRKTGNIILVIDEVHTIVGAGDAEGSMNAANILKPALSRGEIQVIGATTFAEYRKHIEKDAALERRFQPVIVNEPSIDDTVQILQGIAPYYEQHHGLLISPDLCRQAVILSERYITDRYLPDKAIDLLDEAASKCNLNSEQLTQAGRLSRQLDEINAQLIDLQEHKPDDFEAIATAKSHAAQLREQLKEIMQPGPPSLTVEDLARVIEQWTKIPAQNIATAELSRLKALPDRLKTRVVGQDDAIRAICAAIARNRVGLSAKRKPVSLIFAGPTGVGKTELVKQIAADLFNTPESLVRLDMSEFMEKHSVSRIIGSPPGYVGYDEAGQLTEKIRRKPYSVVLFDEIEKAHPDVLNVLLQILDDGMVTDAQGRKVNFENTILVMTTNAGSDKQLASIGFGRDDAQRSADKTLKALKDFLRPEFLNRVDEIVVFKPLPRETFVDIAKIMMNDLKAAMAARGLTLSFDDAALKHMADKSYSTEYGARSLRRYIQREVEDGIAALMIEQCDQPLTHLKVSASDDKLTVLGL